MRLLLEVLGFHILMSFFETAAPAISLSYAYYVTSLDLLPYLGRRQVSTRSIRAQSNIVALLRVVVLQDLLLYDKITLKLTVHIKT